MTRSNSIGTARNHLRQARNAGRPGHAIGIQRQCRKIYYKAEGLSNYGID